MPTPILMPALSPTMEEGALAKWNVKEGDKVAPGDVIAEIETDKATMEVEAVDEGVIGKILVEAGAENVKVNEPIAVLLAEGESADDIDVSALKAGAGAAKGNDGAPAPQPAARKEEDAKAATPPDAAKQSEGAKARSDAADARAPKKNGRIFASPLAKRIAKQEGIDLSLLKGSGPRGRIVKRDIEKALKEGVGKPGAAAPAVAPASVDPRLYPPESYDAVKLDGMRKTIARRLTQSFNQEVPHFPLNIDVELTRLLEARAALNAMAPKEGEGAYKLSVNDFVVKAAAMALMQVPHANATYTDEAILLHKHADIGVAVAIEGGLITPIVWKAETKGLKRISAEIKDLASRARARKLKPEEYQGGTFSVSNLGMFGITSFASIVNQPHGAIMSVGAGEERAVVRGGQIVARAMMTVTLTCDHRVVDGAVGAEFLAAFKKLIEEPSAMLL
ncbi:pyruvate dehydrogenase complex dihydrolipoamide acetyltransferase [Amphiplicatus metriothermophilus]|uniref:Acetyltransferase component of pyruvate dehydrogenase complex n=1 Tax=Amphiplicatus metriothermophilus TaxID=1519374 RepID=A0A239Q0A4_9PROT|nr:pyruvate dehydrogenase complex dihydrolipoamide acetyltransferase [Amphiplicatus metriothermophilus]MBB5520068.1 pyruvate dehydrogenase E2 component (dihydrolipoamide acetyltransferase) [Amphiplicatus metriothermophilus]SNT75860.1 pyruvate dehydrogenase E2 component (dihydrolipoamide acetyltransferase) [Amphiplicatus metriothermophilus]